MVQEIEKLGPKLKIPSLGYANVLVCWVWLASD